MQLSLLMNEIVLLSSLPSVSQSSWLWKCEGLNSLQ